MKTLRIFIKRVWLTIFIGWLLFIVEQYCEQVANSSGGSWIGHVISPLLVLILAIPVLLYVKVLHLPTDVYSIAIITAVAWAIILMFKAIENAEENRLRKIREAEQKKREEEERKIREEQIRKEKEIQRRQSVVDDLLTNLYKSVEHEVNKTLIPTLINELYDIYSALNSTNISNLIQTAKVEEFEEVISSIKAELNRIKKLALEAQARGYTDEEFANADTDDNAMTKEKAYKIFGVNKNATKDEIKRAYRDLVKKYNTDQRTHYEEHVKQMLDDKMKELNTAKDYLSNIGVL